MFPTIISAEQTGYVKGRQILDGIILSHETIPSLKSSKKSGILLKLDLSKDFNKLNWVFMENVLTTFGFDPHYIQWVSNLISMAFFSILLNGAPSPLFNPSLGIRQGNPLTPFLFILMWKG